MQTILSFEDLVTPIKDIRQGFEWQVQTKSSLTTPFKNKFNYFLSILQNTNTLQKLLEDFTCYEVLLAICGFSKKSSSILEKNFLLSFIEKNIDFYQLKNNANYLSDLRDNYLFICGESIGGTIRILTGQLAQKNFTNLNNITQTNELMELPFSLK